MFENIIGNENLKLQLEITLQAAQIRNVPIPHLLLAGRPGTGKTTTAKTLAKESNNPFFQVSAESLKKPADFKDVFDKFSTEGYDEEGNIAGKAEFPIVFIDEIHQMSLKSTEILGLAMEEWIAEVPIESLYSDYKSNAVVWLPRFTLVGATTLTGKMPKPLLDRFKIKLIFNEYTEEECMQIAKYHANKRLVIIDKDAAYEISRRARGTPRIVVSLLDRVCEALAVTGADIIDKNLADSVFQMIGIDEIGLTQTDIKILKALYNFGVPVGLEVLSVVSSEDQKTISTRIEPYLIQKELLVRTKRGRMITESGKKYLEDNEYIEKQNNRRIVPAGLRK